MDRRVAARRTGSPGRAAKSGSAFRGPPRTAGGHVGGILGGDQRLASEKSLAPPGEGMRHPRFRRRGACDQKTSALRENVSADDPTLARLHPGKLGLARLGGRGHRLFFGEGPTKDDMLGESYDQIIGAYVMALLRGGNLLGDGLARLPVLVRQKTTKQHKPRDFACTSSGSVPDPLGPEAQGFFSL